MIYAIVWEIMNNFCTINLILRINFMKPSSRRYNPNRGIYRILSRGDFKLYFPGGWGSEPFGVLNHPRFH